MNIYRSVVGFLLLLVSVFQFSCQEPEPTASGVRSPDPYDPYVGTLLWKVYTTVKDGIPDASIGCIAFASDRVWLLTEETDAVYYLKSGVARCLWSGTIAGDNQRKRLAVDSMDNLWYPEWNGSSYSLMRWTSGTSTLVPHFGGLVNTDVIDVLAKGRKVWVSTAFGAAEYDGFNWRALPTEGWVSKSYLGVGPDGTLWAASARKLIRFNGNSWEVVEDGEINNLFTPIDVNDRGHVWFGDPEGVLFLRNGMHTWVHTRIGSSFRAIACAGRDIVWVASSMGVNRLSSGHWVSFSDSGALDSIYVNCIGIDPGGNTWFGGDGTLTRYSGK